MMKFQRHPYTFVSHVHILIADLERSLAFYKETLGFQLLEQSETKAALTADGKTPLLTIEQPKIYYLSNHVQLAYTILQFYYHSALI